MIFKQYRYDYDEFFDGLSGSMCSGGTWLYLTDQEDNIILFKKTNVQRGGWWWWESVQGKNMDSPDKIDLDKCVFDKMVDASEIGLVNWKDEDNRAKTNMFFSSPAYKHAMKNADNFEEVKEVDNAISSLEL